MNIRGINQPTGAVAGQYRAADAAGRARREGESGLLSPGKDSLELSPEARKLIDLTAAAREKAQQLPEVREDLVKSLRERIAEGTYRVDPQAVARRLLEEIWGNSGKGA